MRELSAAIIQNSEWEVLVVDKPKHNGNIITILPWWKIEKWETQEEALRREVEEEIWILNIQIKQKIWIILWESPTSKTKSKIHLYEIEIPSNIVFSTFKEIKNPRFLHIEELLSLKNVTDLTRDCLELIK